MASSRRNRRHRHRRHAIPRLLHLESLEGRIVLAAGIGYDAASRVLTLTGSEGNDIAEVRQQGRSLLVSLNTGTETLTGSYRASSVKQIVFNGLGGNDSFTNLTGIRCRADGGAGADVLRGGRAADELLGGGENDRLFGNGGNDTLDGGDGDDVVFGGQGNDRIRGGLGDDHLFGEDGNDDLSGGGDDDTIDGGRGNDTGRGDDGFDRLLGGLGVDVLSGGADDDVLDGGAGNDREYGDDGDDDLRGGEGNDFLSGGAGGDDVSGGMGRDTLEGNEGDDHLDGGSGRDRIRGGAGLDREDDSDDRFEDGDDDGDGFDNDHDHPVTPGVISAITFNGGLAQITGQSLHEDDKQYFSFIAAESGTLTVAPAADINGRYPKIEVRNGTTGRELLELEPEDDDGGATSGQVPLIAGNSYLLRVSSPASRFGISFTVNLAIAANG